MLGIIYLALIFWIGDFISRRFVSFVSLPHRFAATFLVGLLASSWFTYLAARLFASSNRPLMWGNLLFFIAVTGTYIWTRKKETQPEKEEGNEVAGEENREQVFAREELLVASAAAGGTAIGTTFTPMIAVVGDEISDGPIKTVTDVPANDQAASRLEASNRFDWVLIGVYFVIACWLMFATLNSSGGQLQIGHNQFSDFGSNTAIMQSFAVGHNFPTEYPHFPGDRIRYHFLYYFQAGNLEFLGLDPAWSLNLLSIFSLVAMLILVMVLGEVLFDSPAVGRIGSALFFFFGSLSYFSYLRQQGSLSAAVQAIRNQVGFLPSGFPYRGEDWGVWSLVVFLNQRHLAFSIAVLLFVLVFLVKRYRAALIGESAVSSEPTGATDWKSLLFSAREFIFYGIVLGVLPMWNSAVFAAAAAVLAVLFVAFPLKKEMLALAVAAGVVALPQVIFLGTGSGRAPSPALFHWGYTLDSPTIINVVKYLLFTFGFKWLLIALALYFATRLQRRFFLSISVLLIVAFTLQLSIEVLANHKFLHIWIIIANLFVAYGLWRLWHMVLGGSVITARAAVVVLLVLITVGGFIDLFPIRNAYWSEVAYKNNPVIDWIAKETDPRAIFLTDRFVSHPILMAGRRVFYGWPYYAWSAGYRAGDRDEIYRQMWQERNPLTLLKLLRANNVSYVALDDGVRQGEFGKNMNEAVYQKYFPSVFKDGSLIVFRVPDSITTQVTPDTTASAEPEEAKSAESMFTGGKGTGNGQFDWPRAIASDNNGNILVGDARSGRIQKFSSEGEFISSFGNAGEGDGQFREATGIAIDAKGNIYVTDFLTRRIQKFKPDGTFLAQWHGPDQNFSPRDLAIGSDNSLYVADEGGARILRFDRDGKIVGTWGAKGSGDGQFDQITSIAVDDKADRVYVADPRQRRIVVFDRKGKFIGNWFVEPWQLIANAWYLHDLIVDTKTSRVFATSTQTDEVIVFDSSGNRIASVRPAAPDKLEGASSLTMVKDKLYVVNTFAARVGVINLDQQDPPAPDPAKSKK